MLRFLSFGSLCIRYCSKWKTYLIRPWIVIPLVVLISVLFKFHTSHNPSPTGKNIKTFLGKQGGVTALGRFSSSLNLSLIRTSMVSSLGPICTGTGIPGAKTEPAFDLLSFDHPSYLDNFKNPCWYETTKLMCVPLLYIVGQPKCGTSDLFHRLNMHPEIADQIGNSAVHWLGRRRFDNKFKEISPESLPNATFHDFAIIFGASRNEVLETTKDGRHPVIIGDASPSSFCDNPHWEEYVGNENCQEPRITNSIYLRHIVPQAKVIVTLRDPVSRLYSSYCYFLHKGSPDDFHERAIREVTLYRDCFKQHSVRQCAYNNTLSKLSGMNVVKGVYSVFLEDWFRTFPRDQIYVTFLEDYKKDPKKALSKIYNFLNVSELSSEELQRIVTSDIRNVGRVRNKSEEMLDKTKEFLQKFYDPFNSKLKVLLSEYPNPT